jgi:hypothetical protein
MIKLTRSSPPSSCASLQVWALSIHISGVCSTKEKEGEKFIPDPIGDLTIQNTRLSLDTMYGFLKESFGIHKLSASAAAAE